MIHIFIGTKAEYVKTSPVLLELARRGIRYNLIDSGQHASSSIAYRDLFGIKNPDHYVSRRTTDVTSAKGLIAWMSPFLWKVLWNPRRVMNDIFASQKGICLIHGDTPTTLLALLAAKRVRMEVAHIESGLRSYNIRNPFPEELIRIVTMRWSDHLFASSDWAYENLMRMRVRGHVYLIEENTGVDALRSIRAEKLHLPFNYGPNQRYVVFSIHRAETILNKKRLSKVVDLARTVSQDFSVLFCLHPPTERQLRRYGFYQSLENLSGIDLTDVLPYPQFIKAIRDAYFIVTDGGSVQEESYYLNVPCLLMRYHTERIEGINDNVRVSKFEDAEINFFLDNIEKFRGSKFSDEGKSPSKRIVDFLCQRHKEILEGTK